VRVAVLVGVRVGVEDAVVPPHEQADRERHDDDPYRYLCGLLDHLRKVLAQKYERQTEEDERGSVAEAPAEAHEGSFPDRCWLLGGYEGGDGGQVIRVAGVPQSQEQAYHQEDAHSCGAVQEPLEPGIYRGHAPLLLSGSSPLLLAASIGIPPRGCQLRRSPAALQPEAPLVDTLTRAGAREHAFDTRVDRVQVAEELLQVEDQVLQ
jgi:hypothetical protein